MKVCRCLKKLLPQRPLTGFSCKYAGCQKTPRRLQARWWRPAAEWTTRWRRCRAGCTASCQKGWRRAPSWSWRYQLFFPFFKIVKKKTQTAVHLQATNGLKVLSKWELHEGISEDGPSHHTWITFITGDHLGASFLSGAIDSHSSLMQFASKNVAATPGAEQTMGSTSFPQMSFVIRANPTSPGCERCKQWGENSGYSSRCCPGHGHVQGSRGSAKDEPWNSQRGRRYSDTSSVTRALRYAIHQACAVGTSETLLFLKKSSPGFKLRLLLRDKIDAYEPYLADRTHRSGWKER